MSTLNRLFAAALFLPVLAMSGLSASAASVSSSGSVGKTYRSLVVERTAHSGGYVIEIGDRGGRGSFRGSRGHHGRSNFSGRHKSFNAHRFDGNRGKYVGSYKAYRAPRIRRGFDSYARSRKVYRDHKYDGPRYYDRKFRHVGKYKPYYRSKRYRYAVPYVAFGYGYYGPCEWLRRRAYNTGDPYWWSEYNSCLDYYYY